MFVGLRFAIGVYYVVADLMLINSVVHISGSICLDLVVRC